MEKLTQTRRYRLILGDEDSRMRRKLQFYRNNFFQLKEIEERKEGKIRKKLKKRKNLAGKD